MIQALGIWPVGFSPEKKSIYWPINIIYHSTKYYNNVVKAFLKCHYFFLISFKVKTKVETVLGAKYLVFLSSRSVKMRDSSAFSVCILFEESVFIFQFLNNKMHNYALFDVIVHFVIQKLNDEIQSYVLFDIIVHFIIQKLKNKHTFLKKYTNWES